MIRRRLLFIGLAALLLGGFSSSVVYRSLQKKIVRPTPGVAVVVAAHDLSPGEPLQERDLKVLTYPPDFLPDGVLHSTSAALRQSLLLPLGKGSFVTSSNLVADKEDRLERLIPAGMRAAAVSVNDVTSVAGFARPGSVVDVLVTGPAADGRRLQSMIVVQRVRILATGSQLEGSVGKDTRETHVVTLLVTPEEAEKLAFAAQQGRIQLAIRNPSDGNQDSRPPVNTLDSTQARKKTIQVKSTEPPLPKEHEVDIDRGGHIERIKLKESPDSPGTPSPGHP
jgi:pilus assembly protein CpaB